LTISLLLEMAASAHPERTAVVDDEQRLTVDQLATVTSGGAGVIAASGAEHVVYVGTGGVHLPLLLFAAAQAGIAFTPLNYRLSPEGVNALIARLPDPLVVVDSEYREMIDVPSARLLESGEFLDRAGTAEQFSTFVDPDESAVVLFTSGTTSRPKAVQLSHSNLTSYVMQTVEFDSAASEDAVLISVPPYHIAGVGAALSNIYSGRTMVYLRRFDPHEWIRLVGQENITTATVVPTMLDRIITALESAPADLPTLRNLAYGGAKVGLPLVRKALELLPDVGFVNAYGLTETSSTIAVLTPDDHRTALTSPDPAVTARLGSVGRPVPGIELEVRDADGEVVPRGRSGELFVRGDQVSGRYDEIGSVLDDEGWFPTRDIATLDADGYLFITGRSDDTIIRGGENIAPAELEDVLIEHPSVHQVVVIGVDDSEWGQSIVAVVVPEPGSEPDAEDLRAFARTSLRGSRTPDRVVFRDELPTTATGKILRRALVEELSPATGIA
jgi:acyl-CoA synthetase (AMP-forming)/AMP-acid ligase II